MLRDNNPLFQGSVQLWFGIKTGTVSYADSFGFSAVAMMYDFSQNLGGRYENIVFKLLILGGGHMVLLFPRLFRYVQIFQTFKKNKKNQEWEKYAEYKDRDFEVQVVGEGMKIFST